MSASHLAAVGGWTEWTWSPSLSAFEYFALGAWYLGPDGLLGEERLVVACEGGGDVLGAVSLHVPRLVLRVEGLGVGWVRPVPEYDLVHPMCGAARCPLPVESS